MKFKVECEIGRNELVWAAWYLINGGQPCTKKRLITFLRRQLSMFGTEVLMGDSAAQDMEDSPEDLERAEARISKWFPEEGV